MDVPVADRPMGMRVAMDALAVQCTFQVFVIVMLIRMTMGMVVIERCVRMRVLVTFPDQQESACQHQGQRQEKCCAGPLPKQEHSDQGAHKRSCSK